MTWYIITLTITVFLSTDHPKYICSVCAEANGKHEFKAIDIDTANTIMWQLKKNGWETKTTHSYNPYSSRIYTTEVRWMHIDNGYRDD